LKQTKEKNTQRDDLSSKKENKRTIKISIGGNGKSKDKQ
jgi:hypothetical protein